VLVGLDRPQTLPAAAPWSCDADAVIAAMDAETMLIAGRRRCNPNPARR